MEIEEKYYNMRFDLPLKKELWSDMEEQMAQLLLTYYNEKYGSLKCIDRPDLQNPDKSLGIEVANMKTETECYVEGNIATYLNPLINNEKREKARKTLNRAGISTEYEGVITTTMCYRDRVDGIISTYNKKLIKLPEYKEKGFNKIGLFLFCEKPPINPFSENIISILKETFKKHDFDIIFINTANHLIVLNEKKNLVDEITINKNDYTALFCKARHIIDEQSS